MQSGTKRYLPHPPSYSDPKLSRLAVDLLQPRLPLPHGPGRKEASPRHSEADGPALFAQGSDVGLKEELPEVRLESARTADNSSPYGLNTSAKLRAPEASPDD